MDVIGKKQFISVLLNHRSFLSGARGGFLFILLAIINFTLIGPIFVPTVPRQPYVKEITIVIPDGGVETSAAAVRNAGFKKVHTLSYDQRIQSNSAFTSHKLVKGTFGDDLTASVNTTFVLFGSVDAFAVAPALPQLPDKPMVIGYSFGICNNTQWSQRPH
jgi:hypothetical protein